MGRLFTIGLVFLWVFSVNAQSQKMDEILMFQSTSRDLTFNSLNHPINSIEGLRSMDSVTTIWSDDFSTPSNWAVVGDTGEWNIVTSITPTLVSQGIDSVINSPSGGNFALIDSDQEGQSGSQDSYLQFMGAIDCSAYSGVRLQFETYLFQYNETREVLVSNDGGANWDVYPVLTGFTSNTGSSNPYTEVVDISATAAGYVSVKVKFHYVGAWDWFWAIDDVMFTSIVDNDLVLGDVNLHDSKSSISKEYYSRIPLAQSIHDSIAFTSEISNVGTATQTNVVLHNSIMSPSSTSLMTSTATSISGGDVDVATINGSYNLGIDGVGSYHWVFYVNSDSTDSSPSNNASLTEIEVTDTTYSRDRNISGAASWNGFYEVGSGYEIFDSAKVTSISVGIENTTPVGSIISLKVYDEDFIQVATSGFIDLTANEIGQIVSFSIPETILNPGKYVVAIGTYTNNVVLMADSITIADPQTVFVDSDQSGTWFWTTIVPVIRLNITDDLFICNLVAVATQTDNNTAVVAVANGVPPYVYLWSTGDTTYSDYSTDTISSVFSGVTYTVQVIDSNNCIANTTVDVVSGVEELEDERTRIYPNPNNGNFQIDFTNVKPGQYQVVIRNVLSQIVYRRTIMVNSNFEGHIYMSEVKKGMYFMEISNSYSLISNTPFIVR